MQKMEREIFIKKLYDENITFLSRLCRKKTGYNPAFTDLIDDCIQETFLVALVEYEKLAEHENPRGWLVQTCIYRLMSAMKQERKREELITLSFEDNNIPSYFNSDTVETYLMQKNAHSFLSTLLSQLTQEEGDIFKAYFYNQDTMQSIAKMRGCSENYIKSVIKRIRRKVKKFSANFFL